MLTIDQQRQQVTVGGLPDGIYCRKLKASNGGELKAGKLFTGR